MRKVICILFKKHFWIEGYKSPNTPVYRQCLYCGQGEYVFKSGDKNEKN